MNLFPFSFHHVKGHSMQPVITECSHIIVFRWAYLFFKPKVGDIIVFRLDRKEVVKRIKAAGVNNYKVEGDNREDSKKMPLISRKSIIGKVIAKY
jgi:signal peptidase I